MPSAEEHELQSEANSQFLFDIKDSFTTDQYNDWKIVVLFYSALHKLQAYFAINEYGMPNHPESHKEILEALKEYISVFKTAFGAYQKLYNLSRTARYRCTTITSQDFADASKYYDDFIHQMQNIA